MIWHSFYLQRYFHKSINSTHWSSNLAHKTSSRISQPNMKVLYQSPIQKSPYLTTRNTPPIQEPPSVLSRYLMKMFVHKFLITHKSLFLGNISGKWESRAQPTILRYV